MKLESGRTLVNWQVELARPLEISGKVVDQDGWPADGCSIAAVRYVYRNGKRLLEARGQGQTNDLGEYWIGGLEPGRYYVRATPFGALSSWDQRYGATYYPAAASLTSAEALDLAPGKPILGVNIRMLRRQGVRLTGEVVLPEGGLSPYAGVGVSLDCEDSSVHPCIQGSQFVKSAGSFTIRDVPPGSYVLQARSGPVSTPQGMQPPFAAYQRVEVGASDLSGFVLKLEPQLPRDVATTVTFESNARPDTVQFILQPLNASTIIEELKPGGSLVFRNILPGRYRWLRMAQPRADITMLYLKSARLGEEDILGREFEIPNQPNGPLRLTIGAIGLATIEGVVLDASGRPAGNAALAAIPTDARIPYSPQRALTDQTGAFIWVAPEGEYRVYAWRVPPPPDSLEDPVFLQSQAAEIIILKPGRNPALKLSLPR